ncbi:Acyl-CoA synthetase, AMP-(fatty) acid ligase [Imhoffiella purpurea]|uniref:Long-chain-fatty-acid--CoA ligase n=1 Tax=Imhoffiella purpurea TaxID=1249627 RepID=W9W0V2_9GAMM|nr:Acyl-CoA synthetase, AMP-(fatty) acid ligase [Imhoffiella purpurea]
MSHDAFLHQVAQVAEGIPEAGYLINLCEDRYRFMLSLCAALVRDIPTLLPPNRLASTVRDIAGRYPGSLVVTDQAERVAGLPHHRIEEPGRMTPAPGSALQVPVLADRPDAIIAFTSGSTGRSQPHPKRWTDQMLCSLRAAKRFGIGPDTSIVATVPPQHMYGLELSVFIPLATGAATHAERPFFPEDIRRALAESDAPRILVTTPVHLDACLKAGLAWPEIDRTISATAPLGEDLARAIESALATRVHEIYGCTEAGSIASRRTIECPVWQWYDGVRATDPEPERAQIEADFLPGTIPLNDRIDLIDETHFRLLGRGGDMVNIGGKRASLADLNLTLNAIPGVREGIVLIPDERDDSPGRLAAILVAPGLDRAELVARLRERIDPVFIPRRILFVDALPRNEVGKTPRQWLLELLRSEEIRRP